MYLTNIYTPRDLYFFPPETNFFSLKKPEFFLKIFWSTLFPLRFSSMIFLITYFYTLAFVVALSMVFEISFHPLNVICDPTCSIAFLIRLDKYCHHYSFFWAFQLHPVKNTRILAISFLQKLNVRVYDNLHTFYQELLMPLVRHPCTVKKVSIY